MSEKLSDAEIALRLLLSSRPNTKDFVLPPPFFFRDGRELLLSRRKKEDCTIKLTT